MVNKWLVSCVGIMQTVAVLALFGLLLCLGTPGPSIMFGLDRWTIEYLWVDIPSEGYCVCDCLIDFGI